MVYSVNRGSKNGWQEGQKMKGKIKWHSILLVGLSLLLVSSVVACGVDKETYEYLSKMQQWREKWHDKWLGEWEEVAGQLDDLVDELEAIETPRDPIPFAFEEGTVDYWTFNDHLEYVFALRSWIFVRGHLHRMQELEEKRYAARGSDEIPSCRVAFEYGEGSDEYKDACWLEKQATEHLGVFRYRLQLLFVLYLPERSEEQ